MKRASLYTISLMATMLIFTLYIFLSSVEIVVGVDLPFINAVSTTNIHDVLPNVALKQKPLSDKINGVPVLLRLPNQNVRLEIIDGTISESGWLTRANKAHYFFADQDGIKDDILIIYLHQGWRTISDPSKIEPGENIYVDTTQWRYLYRITQHYATTDEGEFVISTQQTNQLLFFVENTDSNIMHLFTAEYLDVQPIFK